MHPPSRPSFFDWRDTRCLPRHSRKKAGRVPKFRAPTAWSPPSLLSRGMRPPKDCMLPDKATERILWPRLLAVAFAHPDTGPSQGRIFPAAISMTQPFRRYHASTKSFANIRHQIDKNCRLARLALGRRFFGRCGTFHSDDSRSRVME